MWIIPLSSPPSPPPPQENFNRDYASVSDTEEADRFVMFKKNLIMIDALNRQNPLAKFGITEAGLPTMRIVNLEDEAMNKYVPSFSEFIPKPADVRACRKCM